VRMEKGSKENVEDMKGTTRLDKETIFGVTRQSKAEHLFEDVRGSLRLKDIRVVERKQASGAGSQKFNCGRVGKGWNSPGLWLWEQEGKEFS